MEPTGCRFWTAQSLMAWSMPTSAAMAMRFRNTNIGEYSCERPGPSRGPRALTVFAKNGVPLLQGTPFFNFETLVRPELSPR